MSYRLRMTRIDVVDGPVVCTNCGDESALYCNLGKTTFDQHGQIHSRTSHVYCQECERYIGEVVFSHVGEEIWRGSKQEYPRDSRVAEYGFSKKE